MLLGRTAARPCSRRRILQWGVAPRCRAPRPGERHPRSHRTDRSAGRLRAGAPAAGSFGRLCRVPADRPLRVARCGPRRRCLPLHLPGGRTATADAQPDRCPARPVQFRHVDADRRRNLGSGLLVGPDGTRSNTCGAWRRTLGLRLMPTARSSLRARLSRRLFLSEQRRDCRGGGDLRWPEARCDPRRRLSPRQRHAGHFLPSRGRRLRLDPCRSGDGLPLLLGPRGRDRIRRWRRRDAQPAAPSRYRLERLRAGADAGARLDRQAGARAADRLLRRRHL